MLLAEKKNSEEKTQQEALAAAEELAVKKMKAQEQLWFLVKGENITGPYKNSKILTLINESEISVNDFCWRHGFKEWRPIRSIQEISELIDEKKLLDQRQVPYPEIEAPYRKDLEITLKRKYPEIKEVSPKVVKVRLSKVHKREFAMGELIVVFFFTLALSYFTLDRGLSLVQNNLTKFVQVKTLNRVMSIGNEKKPLNLYLVDPLLSAPGLTRMKNLKIPVQYEGNLKATDNQSFVQPFQLNGYEGSLEGQYFEELDPVYTKRVNVKGLYQPQQSSKEIFVNFKKEIPYLDSSAQERFFDCFHNSLACH